MILVSESDSYLLIVQGTAATLSEPLSVRSSLGVSPQGRNRSSIREEGRIDPGTGVKSVCNQPIVGELNVSLNYWRRKLVDAYPAPPSALKRTEWSILCPLHARNTSCYPKSQYELSDSKYTSSPRYPRIKPRETKAKPNVRQPITTAQWRGSYRDIPDIYIA
uniref:Uncharacterized protein n=1 Tax=Steinernema glaseri TaxID=37863 RepID=A0A1I7YRA8_9BILA